MTDPTSRSHTEHDGAPPPRRGSSAGLAGWQKLVGIIGLAVVLVLAILLTGGDHDPGRHAPAGSQQQPALVEGGSDHDPSRWNQ